MIFLEEFKKLSADLKVLCNVKGEDEKNAFGDCGRVKLGLKKEIGKYY